MSSGGAALRPATPPGVARMSSRSGTPTNLRRRPMYASQRSVISIQSRDPRKPPQFFFVNPMNVANMTGKGIGTAMSQGVNFAKKIKDFSEKWFSHLMLVLLVIIYCFIGAAMFRWIEAPSEAESIKEIVFLNDTRAALLDTLQSNLRNRTVDAWKKFAEKELLEHEKKVLDLDDMDFRSNYTTQWTFPGSLFYCMTIVTTLGYGNISPSTTTGKIATIFYGIIGIPLLLMVLADLGKLFTRWIKWFFFLWKHFYRTGTCTRKDRKKNGPVQYVAFVWQKVNDKMTYVPYPAYMKPKIKPPDGGEDGSGTDIESRKADTEAGQSEMGEDFAAEVDDEFNLPVSIALMILSLYMTAGAILFTVWEPWDFTDSFYFVFISMSTVGFGDLVPEHPIFMMATFIYLLFGLALTSMCINVVQEKLSAIFQKAKMQLGTTIGFDPSMLTEEVIEEEDEDVDEEEDALSPMADERSKEVTSVAKAKPKPDNRKKSIAGSRRSSKAPKKPEINIDELIKSGKGVDATRNMQYRP